MATEKTEYKNVFAITPAPQPATDPEEFKRFYDRITRGRPGYTPWLIPLGKGEVVLKEKKTKISGKDPSLYGGWKDEKNRLTFEQAYKRLQNGLNVGVAATDKDPYVILDVDDMGLVGDTKPTLQAISRKRLGRHNFYITEERTRGEDNPYDTTAKDNIPLDVAGELRSCWQYVVAPGSFVPCGPEEYNSIPEEDKHNAGKYSLLNPIEPTSITFNELPEVFRAKRIADIRNAIEHDFKNTQKQKKEPGDKHSNSRIFELSAGDVLGYTHRDFEKFSSPLHGSSTGANASFTGPLLHCWRHNVSHSGYSLLAVQAGLYECGEAGTPHKKAGCSYLKYDGEEIFKVWEYAKREGIIPTEDPIPSKALVYFAVSSGICKETDIIDGWKLPTLAYNRALSAILKGGINPGRTLTGEGQDATEATRDGIEPETAVEELTREEILQKGAKCTDLRLTVNVPRGHLIDKIKKYVERRTDAYPDYAYCASFWLISACTQGRAVLELAQEDVKANIWFMLFGLSSVSRKSTVLGMVKRKYETCTGDYVANHEYSIQGYYEDLEEHRVSNFIRDEAAGQLHNMHKKHNDGMAQVECLVYDGQSITKKLASKKGKKDEVHVRDPYVTKLDATTPDNYFSAINTDDLHSGFVARYLYCHPKYQRQRMPMRMADKDTSDDTELIIAISSIWDYFTRSDTVSFTIGNDAMDYYNECVETMEDQIMETGDNLLSMGWARNQVHILKIAMLIEIGKERISTHISLETMQEAARVVTEYFLPVFMETAGRIQHTDMYNKIEKVREVLLKNNGTVNRSMLLRYSRLLKDDFDRVIQTMFESGEIEAFQEKGSKKIWYVLKAETSHFSPISHNSHVHMGIEKSCEDREFSNSSHEREKNNSQDNEPEKKEEAEANNSPYTCGYVLDSTCEAVKMVNSVNSVKAGEDKEDPQLDKRIEGCLDKWEKHHGRIFAGNKVRVPFDISRYTDANGIDSKLIFDAVEKRSKHRCLDCGVDTHLNEEIGKGYRCKSCHDIYSNPPPVVIPEEISLEPKEDSPCTHPAHTVVINVTKTTWASVKDLPADCVYIGRNNNRWKIKDKVRYNFKKSKWHNKYIEDDLKNGKKRDGTREEVIEKFRKDTLQNDELLEDLPELFGKSFVCWHPGPCHGDILLEFRDISFSGYSVVGRCITANEFRSLYSATQEAGRELSSDEIMQILSRSDVRMPAENNPEPVEVTT